MSDNELRSAFAADIEAFVSHKNSLGYPYDAGKKILRRFDEHCADKLSDETELTREIVMSWSEVDEPGITKRVHDLRHTFCVHRLNAWMREGKDAAATPHTMIPRRNGNEPRTDHTEDEGHAHAEQRPALR